MELYALSDLSGSRATADPSQQAWGGTSHDWLSRRMAVLALKVRAQHDGRALHTRRPHRLLRLRGWGNRSNHGLRLTRPPSDGASGNA